MPAKLNYKIFIGRKFGHLLVNAPSNKQDDHGRYLADCSCLLCGKDTEKQFKEILNGHTKSCGCLKKTFGSKVEKNLLGKTFGKLTILEKTEKRNDGRIMWRCKCSCGNIVSVGSSSLISKNTQSCGCIHKGIVSALGKRTGLIYGKINGPKLKGRFTREKSPHWLGGKSFEPYSLGWDNALKGEIRQMYSNRCQLCDLEGKNNDIHHIDYNKQNCSVDNLILLCHSCHTKTNYNRNYWQQLLSNKIKKGDYKNTSSF